MILDEKMLEKYDDFMSTSKVYDCLPIIYPILGLNGEAGEAAEKVKKCLRDNNGKFDEETKNAIKKELADVLWYIWAAADDMNTSLDEIMSIGIKKVKERQETNTVHGSGDNREEQVDAHNIEDILSEGYDADFPEYSNHYIDDKSVYEPLPRKSNETKLNIGDEHKVIKLVGDFESLKKISYKLSYTRSKKVHIVLKDDNYKNAYEYDGEFIALGRIDGGLIIKLNDESKTKELIENLHELTPGLQYYMCEINGDLLLERRISEIPILMN